MFSDKVWTFVGFLTIFKGLHWFSIAFQKVFSEFERRASAELEPGDVLFFHSLVPHAASVNLTQFMRFVVNLRYFDMTESAFVSAGWQCGQLAHAREALSRRHTK